MKNTVPRTPFSTALSGSARETELRIRNIFSGPKKRPPVLFLALMFSVCLLCGNLVSCQVAEAEDRPDASDASQQEAEPLDQKDPFLVPAKDLSPDINHNGIPEEIRLENEYGWEEVRFYENGELIDREQPGVCLYCYTGGPWYILRTYADNEYPGAFFYSYHIADLSGEFEEPLDSNYISFDLNFNAPFHKGFDPEAIAAYVDELNGSGGLYSHSWRLVVRDGELVAEDPVETLPWLDAYSEVFTRDPDKSLVENLQDFQAAMTAAYSAPAPQPVDTLPITEPLKMTFASGAGAWCTDLALNPNGSFVGDYRDNDGPIQYVCQFHGKFGGFEQLTDNSWSLTLEELVLDTKYPMGQEWDEGEFHCISSGPTGFTDTEGQALKPGVRFILYSPEATGNQPGTELYGAYAAWDWCLPRPDLAGGEPLGCWDLYNLTTDIGFFSET